MVLFVHANGYSEACNCVRVHVAVLPLGYLYNLTKVRLSTSKVDVWYMLYREHSLR